MKKLIEVFQMSDIGLHRNLNEDSLLCRPPSDFAVADGMVVMWPAK